MGIMSCGGICLPVTPEAVAVKKILYAETNESGPFRGACAGHDPSMIYVTRWTLRALARNVTVE